MTHCPTCGQPVLPSMGDRVARAVDNDAQTPDIQAPTPTPLPPRLTLTLHIGNSASSPSTETTPRGYKTQQVIRRNGKRYRVRLNITNFPRRGTMGGKLTVIALGKAERSPVQYELPEQITTYPQAPYQHEFLLPVSLGEETAVPVRIILSAVGA